MTDQIDLDGLERLVLSGRVLTRAEALALISQAREAERMRGALERISKVEVSIGVEPIPGTKGPQMVRLAEPARIARQALAPATGSGE